MDTMSSANTKFGLDLFRVIASSEPNSNAFISPFSVSMALSMTQLGAEGETATCMVEGLRWEQGKEQLVHEQNQRYLTLLQRPNEAYKLSVANRLYIEKGYQISSDFLQQTKKYYLAEAVSSEFKVDPEIERVKINKWVAEQTQDKIRDLLAPDVLDKLTRMVLINAIYFKGLWKNAFKAWDTRPRPFKLSNTESKDVPTMYSESSYSIWFDDGKEGFSALELPYKGGNLSMVILLPTADFGLEDVEKSLTEEKLKALFSKLSPPDELQLLLPKFEMTCNYSMKQPLCKLGMSVAFNLFKADFSRMTQGKELYISEVVHKAFVKVDEEGTEAVAATAAAMFLAEAEHELPTFIVDHPFLFVIRDKSVSDSILFMGRVCDPSQ